MRNIKLNNMDLSKTEELRKIGRYIDKKNMNKEEVKKELEEREVRFPLIYKVNVPVEKLEVIDDKGEKTLENVNMSFDIKIDWERFNKKNVRSIYIENMKILKGKRKIKKDLINKIKTILERELPFEEAISKINLIKKDIEELVKIYEQKEEEKRKKELEEARKETEAVTKVLKDFGYASDKDNIYRINYQLYIITDKNFNEEELNKLREDNRFFYYESARYGYDKTQEKINEDILTRLNNISKKQAIVTVPFQYTRDNAPNFYLVINEGNKVVDNIKYISKYNDDGVEIKYPEEEIKRLLKLKKQSKMNL